MRIADIRVLVLVLALGTVGCGMHHRHHGHMGMGCGPESCGYQSKCFSEGAARSNDGVCQACSGGKWVAASGCRDRDCDDCCGKKGEESPCPHGSKHGHRHKK
jgi:hypothetical protein